MEDFHEAFEQWKKGLVNVPIIIVNFNQVVWPKRQVAFFQSIPGTRVIICDNASTYKPLLEWYETKPCEIRRMPTNYKQKAPWLSGLATELLSETKQPFYAVTDPDLDFEGVPVDLLSKALQFFVLYGFELHKVGVSLKIEDLPATEVGIRAAQWEAKFWTRPVTHYKGTTLPCPAYEAPIDTTFAVYRARSETSPRLPGQLRLAPPYMAKHMPWYLTETNLADDYRIYLKTVKKGVGHWSPKLRKNLSL
jgi:hypothetical protein